MTGRLSPPVRLAGFLLLLGALPAMATAASLQTRWGGHLRTIGSAALLDADSAQRTIDRDPYWDGQGEVRLKNRLDYGDHWALETHYELVALGGDLRESGERLAGRPGGAGEGLYPAQEITDETRLLDFTGLLTDEDRWLAYHRLDRLNLSYRGAWGALRLGRQALTWGQGLVFNPMDLIGPFAPTAVQRDYKTGEDMAHLQLPLGAVDAEALYLPRREADSGDLREDRATYALKLHAPVGAWEVGFMGARHYGAEVLGLAGSGYLGEALWRLNLTYTRVDDGDGDGHDDFLQAVANLDYAWIWGAKNCYGLVELYYNGLGRNGDYDTALTDETLTSRMARGEIFTLGRYYLAGRVQVELHPLVQAHATAIVNLHDPSGLLQPQLLWDLAADWQLILGGQWYWGGRGSEFGGYRVAPYGERLLLAPADRLYLWLSFFF